MINLNLDRLVRSASTNEDYCSYIIESLWEEHSDKMTNWTDKDINKIWKEASSSDLTVSQFIDKHKEKLHGL